MLRSYGGNTFKEGETETLPGRKNGGKGKFME